MIELGRIAVYDVDTFNEARRKMLRLTAALGFDTIQATKLATICSELCRPNVSGPTGVGLTLGLTQRAGRPCLSLLFSFGSAVRPTLAAGGFFDAFTPGPEMPPSSFLALKELPDHDFQPSDALLKQVRDMLALPTREELLRSLKSKNDDLEAEVTERKRTERALRESEARILTVLEGAPDALVIVDQAGTITFVNSQAERTFGYAREEMLGERIEMLVPEDRRTGHPARRTAFFASQPLPSQAGLQDAVAEVKGGGRIAVDIKLSPIETESGPQVIASVRDVTEQKKAQESIKKLSQVVEQSPVSVTITNRDGLIEYVNPAFCGVTGYSLEEALGRTPSFLKSGKTPAAVYEELWATILDGRHWKGSFLNRRKNGEEYWESATIAPIANAAGTITHFVSVKEDISERMRMEEAVRESEVKYRELVENANSIILKLDESGNITFFNEFAQEFFGFDEDEVLGRSIVGTLVPEEDSTGRDLKALIRDIGRNPDAYANNENENSRKDGSRVWVSWTNRALLDETTEEVVGVLCVGLDITAQRHAQMERDAAAQALDMRNQELANLSNKLSKYLSPQVYASIFSGDRDVKLTTERKKLTVFFSDIKDFTQTTDDLQPEDLTALLNRYFTEMSKISLEHGATIDKFIGDAMLMFFGDPQTLGVQEDAKACVRMAVAMQRRMRELEGEWRNLGYEKPFRMRIGINTGYCNVGNFGSEDRMDYTIIGGEVNLAARLEGQADPGGILMSYETYSQVSDIVAAEERPPMTVKGIRRQVRPYSVLGLYDDLEGTGRFINCHEDGLRLQLDMDKLTADRRDAAIQELEKALSRLKKA
ncbi:MAG: PAS domain S-box protein [Desulfovibrionaceae bacterium]